MIYHNHVQAHKLILHQERILCGCLDAETYTALGTHFMWMLRRRVHLLVHTSQYIHWSNDALTCFFTYDVL